MSEAGTMNLDNRIALAGFLIPDTDTVYSRVRHWVSSVLAREAPLNLSVKEPGSQAVLEASVDPTPISRRSRVCRTIAARRRGRHRVSSEVPVVRANDTDLMARARYGTVRCRAVIAHQ